MATAPALPFTKPKETDKEVSITMDDQVAQPGGRKRRASRRRGGFREQGVNTASPVPTAPQGPLGGRRRTRKSKGRKRQTRRR